MKQPGKSEYVQLLSDKQVKRRTFISFAGFIGLHGLAYTAWRWLYKSPLEERTVTAGARKPLRQALNKTELAARKVFSPNHLVKTYPRSMAAKKVRVNSLIGMDAKERDVSSWRLTVKKRDGTLLYVGINEIIALPKTEIVFDFKCIEGWNQISHWGGVRFSDFMKHFKLERETELGYVALATPDAKYYVGIDMPSAMHSQTLLAYEVNGKPLPPVHGQPLRLIIPVKYGVKNLKLIGSLTFSNVRPPDYWAERGYDYYSGL